MQICKNCGKQNQSHVLYCKFCGAPISEEYEIDDMYPEEQMDIEQRSKLTEDKKDSIATKDDYHKKPHKKLNRAKSKPIKDLISEGIELKKKAKRAKARCAVKSALDLWKSSLEIFERAKKKTNSEKPRSVDKLNNLIKETQSQIEEMNENKEMIINLIYKSINKDTFIQRGLPTILEDGKMMINPIYGQKVFLNYCLKHLKSYLQFSDYLTKFTRDPKKYNNYCTKVLKFKYENKIDPGDDDLRKLNIPLEEKDLVFKIIDVPIDDNVISLLNKKEMDYYSKLAKIVINSGRDLDRLDLPDYIELFKLNFIDSKVLPRFISDYLDLRNYDIFAENIIDFKEIQREELDVLNNIATDFLRNYYDNRKNYDLMEYASKSKDYITEIIKAVYLLRNPYSFLKKTEINLNESNIGRDYDDLVEYTKKEDKVLNLELLIREFSKDFLNSFLILKRYELSNMEKMDKALEQELFISPKMPAFSPATGTDGAGLRGIKIFLSYSPNDADKFKIKQLVKKLESFPEFEHIYYWERYSEDINPKYIEQTIASSDFFIPFCTKVAGKSPIINNEWKIAYQLSRNNFLRVIPIYKKRDLIPSFFKEMQFVEYRDWIDKFTKELYDVLKKNAKIALEKNQLKKKFEEKRKMKEREITLQQNLNRRLAIKWKGIDDQITTISSLQSQRNKEFEQIQKLNRMLNVSKRLKIDLARKVLNLDEETFSNKIQVLANRLGLKIEGDYIMKISPKKEIYLTKPYDFQKNKSEDFQSLLKSEESSFKKPSLETIEKKVENFFKNYKKTNFTIQDLRNRMDDMSLYGSERAYFNEHIQEIISRMKTQGKLKTTIYDENIFYYPGESTSNFICVFAIIVVLVLIVLAYSFAFMVRFI